MTYSSSISFNATTGIVSGQLVSSVPPAPPALSSVEPVSDVVVSGYSDANVGDGAAYFAQARTDGGGNWALSTMSLPAGNHTIAVAANYGAMVASTTITTMGAGTNPLAGSTRRDLQVNSASRS